MQQPRPSELHHLCPVDSLAWRYVVINALMLGGGLVLAHSSEHPALYAVSQLLLMLGFSQALVIMHEAGHRTLFRQRRLNDLVGMVSGYVALVPYASWRPIHAGHHRYTGWQDLDSTTASLLPRQLSPVERLVINVAWRCWLPLFSVIYRVQNYWNVGRIKPFLGPSIAIGRLWLFSAMQLLAYVAVLSWWGVYETAVLLGPGLLLALMLQDLILLGQHTHMPTYNSGGNNVRPFRPIEQSPFTRSVRLPGWLSWLLLRFDAHELHHLYPAVPGYLLLHIPYVPPNEVHWWSWIREAKRMSGSHFLFGGPHLDRTAP